MKSLQYCRRGESEETRHIYAKEEVCLVPAAVAETFVRPIIIGADKELYLRIRFRRPRINFAYSVSGPAVED
jgi:hypothetical protein